MDPRYNTKAHELAYDYARTVPRDRMDSGVYTFPTSRIPSSSVEVVVLVVETTGSDRQRLQKSLNEEFLRVVGHAPGTPCDCCGGTGVK